MRVELVAGEAYRSSPASPARRSGRLQRANTGRSPMARGTRRIDPLLPSSVAPANGREARESSPRLKANGLTCDQADGRSVESPSISPSTTVLSSMGVVDRPVDTRAAVPLPRPFPCNMDMQPCPWRLRPVICLRH